MLNWIARVKEHQRPIADAAAVLSVGIGLCVALVIFVACRMSAYDWDLEIFGLSEDGTYYASICEQGMRLHEVASGKEVDRLELKPVWERLMRVRPRVWHPLHPLELSAPQGFNSDGWTLDYDFKRADIRSRVIVAESGRYVAGIFPAGYALLWDRKSRRSQVVIEPAHVFENAWIDESRKEIIFEAVAKPEAAIRFPLDHLQDDIEGPKVYIHSRDLIRYHLDDFARVSLEQVEQAGKRLQGERNVRMVKDSDGEIRVLRWEEFPKGKPTELFRTRGEDVENPEYCSLRLVDDKLYVVLFRNDEIEFREADNRNKPAGNVQRFPAHDEYLTGWLAKGRGEIARGAAIDSVLITWDGVRSASHFQAEDNRFSDAVLLRTSGKVDQVRFASEEGQVVDLPVGQEGPIVVRQMDLNSYAYLPVWCSGAVLTVTLAWFCYIATSRRLFARSGWQVLLLLLSWPLLFWSIEYALSGGPRGLLLLSLTWLLMGMVGVMGLCSLTTKEGLFRGAVLCSCSLFGMLILCEFSN